MLTTVGTAEGGFRGWLARLFGRAPRPVRVSPAAATEPGRAEPLPRFDFAGLVEDDAGARAEPSAGALQRAEEIARLAYAHFRAAREDVPALPSQASRVTALLRDPDVSVNEVVRLINNDPALASQVVKVANSVLFGGAVQIESIRDAVVRIGLKEVGHVVVTASMRNVFAGAEDREHAAFSEVGSHLWHRAMTVAHAASGQALGQGWVHAEVAFMGGMLHTVAKAVALRSLYALSDDGAVPDVDAGLVERVLERVHIFIAPELAEMWHLTPLVAACCAPYREPVEPLDGDSRRVLLLVRLVAAMNELRCNPWRSEELPAVAEATADELRMNFYQLRALHTQIRESAERVVGLM